MKKLLLLLVIIPLVGISQDYEIANWYNFKKGAVCLTFDDGTLDHRDNAIPVLNSKGFSGTFFLNKKSNYSWPKSAINQGHEMGNHTMNHVHLSNIDTNLFKDEITNFQNTIQNELDSPVNTFAYPYGEGGETNPSVYYIQDSISKTHIGARSVTQPIDDNAYKYNFYQNDRAYYQVNTIHMKNSMKSYKTTFNKVINYGGLMTYMFHSIGNKGGFDYMGITEFNNFLDTLKNYESRLWISTFEHAIKYHREKKSAILTTTSAPFTNGNTWKLKLTDTLDNTIYDHDLTIKLSIPSEIKGILAAYQNNAPISFRVENDSILFNAKPDDGIILFDIVDCEQPSNKIEIKGKSMFCLPDSIIIEAIYNPEYVYSWFKDNKPYSTDTNRIVIKENGSFNALIKLNDCPIKTDTSTVIVTGICGTPKTSFSVSTVRDFLNEKITFVSTSTNLDGGEEYFWDFGEGASTIAGLQKAEPIEVTYRTPGLKTISLITKGSIGSDTLIKTDHIEIVPMNGCDIYKEDFKGNYDQQFFGCWCNYTTSIVNDAFRITTNESTANEWFSVSWEINNKAQSTPIDFSDLLYKPVLKIRAKASDTARIAFSLKDTSHTSTAGLELNQISYFDVTTEYQTFEVDFSNLFYYEWNSPSTPVDSSQIAYIQMTINEGWISYPVTNSFGQKINTQFVGNVDIDWISIGEKCEVPPLIANIVLPKTVCANQTFNVWNHSSPKLKNAQFSWTFDTSPTNYDIITTNDLPLEISYSEIGKKAIKLEIITEENKIITATEHIQVNDCEVGIEEIENQLSTTFINPIKNSVEGTIHSKSDQNGIITLCDVKGKVIINERINLKSGPNEVQYKNLKLPSGTYLLTIHTGTKSHQVKLVSP